MEPKGDSALMIRFGERIGPQVFRRIRQFLHRLDKESLPAMQEYVPAYTSVLVHYDVIRAAEMMERYEAATPYEAMARWCASVLERMEPGNGPHDHARKRKQESGSLIETKSGLEGAEKTVEIPVCYGGEYGPDLEFVARHNGLTPEEVIRMHAETEYFAYMVGFLPGFPYLGGLPERLATPRRETPRLEVPAGSVGIAGSQTGIYPLASPGGWQLIGRTPLALFRPDEDPPVLVKPGDKVRFKPISAREYEQWSGTAGDRP